MYKKTKLTVELLKDQQESLYNMELFEEWDLLTANHMQVLRVPGGWVITRSESSHESDSIFSSCFVPYDNEFQTKS